ncbi:putative holin [Polaromonas sp. UC242_47]|uniref:putative holin n=2 Tax=Polaromonas sp. UC242_47 TaxID=3374626 RepID=UPI0037B8A177
MFLKLPRMLVWLVLTIVLMGLALLLQAEAPGNLVAVTLYKAHLLSLGGWGGYWLDRALFPHARPHELAELLDADAAARMAYAAYCRTGGGKTFDGKPLPTYEVLGADRQACWESAVTAVFSDRDCARAFDLAELRRAVIVAACLITVGLGA